MSEPIDHLLEAFHRVPDSDKRAFLERLESEGWYRDMVCPLQEEWDNPRDDAYTNLFDTLLTRRFQRFDAVIGAMGVIRGSYNIMAPGPS